MDEKKPEFRNYGTDDGSSIFDQHSHRNQEGRERQIRILRLVMIGVATIVLAFIVYRLSAFGARVATSLIGELEQPTPTATLDLSGLVVASPTPPATSTVLSDWTTFEQEVPTLDPDDPDATRSTGAITFEAEPTRSTGAISFEAEPTMTPTPTMTPLPTAEFGNFNRNEEAPTLSSLGWSKDPRCSSEETEADYVLCVVRLAEEPIEP